MWIDIDPTTSKQALRNKALGMDEWLASVSVRINFFREYKEQAG